MDKFFMKQNIGSLGIFNGKKILKLNITVKQFIIYTAILILLTDTIYKIAFGISYMNKEACILYSSLPRWAFLLYEYFIELILIVLVGIFIAALVEKYFIKIKNVIPKNPIHAFLYGSILPVCSCAVIPLVTSLKNKITFRTIITFVIAAPLLNPYIIILSFTVLGIKYGILRIICSFILAVSSGFAADFFHNKKQLSEEISFSCSKTANCMKQPMNIFDSTFKIFRQIIPYLLIAGAMGIAIEVAFPAQMLNNLKFNSSLLNSIIVIIVGIPVYFCNGADVIFLRPIINHAGLPLGAAMAFSLTSTSVCITSLVMLIKFIGKKLTFIILVNIFIVTLILSLLIQLV